MNKETFLDSLAELVDLPAGFLHGPEKLADLAGWNSMAMIGYVALADENGAAVSRRDMLGAVTIQDLLALAAIAC